jgi:hypothetical protein
LNTFEVGVTYACERIVLAAVCCLAGVGIARAQSPATIADQFSTAERVKKPGWWPTKGDAPKNDYTDAAACTRCHSEIAASQKTTPMSRTSRSPANSELLRAREKITLTQPPYTYQMTPKPDGETYSVIGDKQTVSEPLTWAFGTGNHGQSYLFNHEDALYEGRISYYSSSQSFGLTPNHPTTPAESLEKAIGRKVSGAEAQKCFGCHTTASTVSGKFTAEKSTPGITCEVCHGPGAAHVAMESNGFREEGAGLVLNPKHLAPSDSVDFCGACHRTWWDVNQDGLVGIGTLRFPAYRLEKSRCWGKGDARITCVACHDPHQQLVKDAGSYDQKCLSCHAATASQSKADHPGAACPVATKDCVTCHMPKYETPDMHTKFTDHMIRVVRKEGGKDVIPE